VPLRSFESLDRFAGGSRKPGVVKGDVASCHMDRNDSVNLQTAQRGAEVVKCGKIEHRPVDIGDDVVVGSEEFTNLPSRCPLNDSV